MKRIFSLIMVLVIMAVPFTAGANEAVSEDIAYVPETAVQSDVNKESVSVETGMQYNLCFGEMAKVVCTITNTAEPMGASAKLYLDGKQIEGAGSEYFVLYEKNIEGFEFCVPATLDPYYEHTLLLELTCDNGQVIYKSCMFTVSSTPEISMEFFSTPYEVNQGVELYFGVEFKVPGSKAFKLYGAGYVRDINIEESNQELIVRNGDRIFVRVPESFNSSDPSDFKFAFIVGAGYENTGFAPVSLVFDTKPAYVEPSGDKAIRPLVIPATVNYTVNAYGNASLTGYVTTVPGGTVVEYMNPDNHNSMRAAKIKLDSGTVCWVSMAAITISTIDYTIEDVLTNEDREAFVNSSGYSSKTDYLIWVNKERQRLTLFMGKQGAWSVVKVYPVATGKNTTPTPTTVCEYKGKTRWVTSSYVCDPVMSLYDGYAIHNQPVSHGGYVIDPTIGHPASAGCIRMLLADARELCYYTPVGTTVVLY